MDFSQKTFLHTAEKEGEKTQKNQKHKYQRRVHEKYKPAYSTIILVVVTFNLSARLGSCAHSRIAKPKKTEKKIPKLKSSKKSRRKKVESIHVRVPNTQTPTSNSSSSTYINENKCSTYYTNNAVTSESKYLVTHLREYKKNVQL